jgi:hypothetical protein
MEILVIVSEGLFSETARSGVSVREQSEEFHEGGLELVKRYFAAKGNCNGMDIQLYLPESIRAHHIERLQSASQEKQVYINARTAFYTDKNKLVATLSNRDNERTCLIVIGHGFSIVIDQGNTASVGGAVQLLDGKGANESITSEDIDVINPDVYIGLHCHAGAMLQRLPHTCIGFGVSGMSTAQNNHISDFCRSDELGELFERIALLFVLLDDAEADKPMRQDQAHAVIETLGTLRELAPDAAEITGGKVFANKTAH